MSRDKVSSLSGHTLLSKGPLRLQGSLPKSFKQHLCTDGAVVGPANGVLAVVRAARPPGMRPCITSIYCTALENVTFQLHATVENKSKYQLLLRHLITLTCARTDPKFADWTPGLDWTIQWLIIRPIKPLSLVCALRAS